VVGVSCGLITGVLDGSTVGEDTTVGVDAGPGCATCVAVAAVSAVAVAMGRGVLVRDGATRAVLLGRTDGGFVAVGGEAAVGTGATVEATVTGFAVACDAVTGAPIESGVLSGMAFSMRTGVMVDVTTGEIVAQPVIAGRVGCWVGLLSISTVAVPAVPSVILMLLATRLLSTAMSPSMCALLPMEGTPWICVFASR
jgi:hypothetical protein